MVAVPLESLKLMFEKLKFVAAFEASNDERSDAGGRAVIAACMATIPLMMAPTCFSVFQTEQPVRPTVDSNTKPARAVCYFPIFNDMVSLHSECDY